MGRRRDPWTQAGLLSYGGVLSDGEDIGGRYVVQIEICRMQKRELRKKKNEAHGWAGLERKGETSAKLEKTRSSCPLDCGFADGPDTARPDLDGLPIRTYLKVPLRGQVGYAYVFRTNTWRRAGGFGNAHIASGVDHQKVSLHAYLAGVYFAGESVTQTARPLRWKWEGQH